MAEAFDPGGLPRDKAERYRAVAIETAAVLRGEPDRTARMATVAAMLAASFEHYLWVGFYVVDPARPRELVIGPYQGALGCLRIGFGRGVCGTVAASGRSLVVADVHAFPGHIMCDSRAASEIVVPVRNSAGELVAVLDVDSAQRAAFDDVDRVQLESLLDQVFAA